jgi:hypothetical protein
LGHLPKTKAVLSGSNMRLVARSVIIGCVLEVVIIQLLYNGEALPQGLYITFPIALILGTGFHFVTPALAILLMYLIEFPLTRVFQLTILPWISFDKILEEHHNEKS